MIIKKIRAKIITYCYLIRYHKHLILKGRNTIEKRVQINQFNIGKNSLEIVMDFKANIKHDVILQGSGKIYLGQRSFIGSYSVIGCNESIKFEHK